MSCLFSTKSGFLVQKISSNPLLFSNKEIWSRAENDMTFLHNSRNEEIRWQKIIKFRHTPRIFSSWKIDFNGESYPQLFCEQSSDPSSTCDKKITYWKRDLMTARQTFGDPFSNEKTCLMTDERVDPEMSTKNHEIIHSIFLMVKSNIEWKIWWFFVDILGDPFHSHQASS
jgi:hypothetical protein